jgi:hypothetical protein
MLLHIIVLQCICNDIVKRGPVVAMALAFPQTMRSPSYNPPFMDKNIWPSNQRERERKKKKENHFNTLELSSHLQLSHKLKKFQSNWKSYRKDGIEKK